MWIYGIFLVLFSFQFAAEQPIDPTENQALSIIFPPLPSPINRERHKDIFNLHFFLLRERNAAQRHETAFVHCYNLLKDPSLNGEKESASCQLLMNQFHHYMHAHLKKIQQEQLQFSCPFIFFTSSRPQKLIGRSIERTLYEVSSISEKRFIHPSQELKMLHSLSDTVNRQLINTK
jgi:hypothetical protein